MLRRIEKKELYYNPIRPSVEKERELKQANASIAGYEGSDEEVIKTMKQTQEKAERSYMYEYEVYWKHVNGRDNIMESKFALDIMIAELDGSENLARLQANYDGFLKNKLTRIQSDNEVANKSELTFSADEIPNFTRLYYENKPYDFRDVC